MRTATYIGYLFLEAVLAASAIASDAAEPYVPGLGEFMTAAIQPHHIKLWFAATAGDWKLAAYEANELDETFDDVVTYQAQWHKLPISQLVKATLMPPLERVIDAINLKNLEQFRSSYAQLNAACNSCHVAADHGFVKIVVPASNSFADQQFGER